MLVSSSSIFAFESLFILSGIVIQQDRNKQWRKPLRVMHFSQDFPPVDEVSPEMTGLGRHVDRSFPGVDNQRSLLVGWGCAGPLITKTKPFAGSTGLHMAS